MLLACFACRGENVPDCGADFWWVEVVVVDVILSLVFLAEMSFLQLYRLLACFLARSQDSLVLPKYCSDFQGRIWSLK